MADMNLQGDDQANASNGGPAYVSNFDTQLERIERESEEKAVAKLANQKGYGYIDIEHYPLNPDVLRHIEVEDAHEASLMPFYQKGKRLKIAFVDESLPAAKAVVTTLQKAGFTLQYYLCSANGLNKALEFYMSGIMQKKAIEAHTTYDELEHPTLAAHKAKFQKLEENLEHTPIEISVSELELLSLSTKASDVHLQPYPDGWHVRFRVDGVLHDVMRIPTDIGTRVVRHIKYQAGMKSNIMSMPQDGHSRFAANDREVDLRVSTLPTQFGESVVMRVLDPSRGIKTFEELGFSRSVHEKILWVLDQSNGLILVTGPTGSGKTTTLYSMLKQLNNADRKLLTLEDPIEYQMLGVTQSQVNDNAEYNFDSGLKALLRHDPDVILVGEIRTLNTAKLATEASLTGHMVLSSLHTNSSVGAISRLRNMGMEDFNIAPSLRAVFAQRLVRKVCEHCVGSMPLPNNETFLKAITRITEVYPDVKIPKTIPKAVGCDICSGTGYNGMLAVCEAFLVDDPVHILIMEGESDIAILRHLQANSDFMSLSQDGIYKVLQGITTLNEVYRVTAGQ